MYNFEHTGMYTVLYTLLCTVLYTILYTAMYTMLCVHLKFHEGNGFTVQFRVEASSARHSSVCVKLGTVYYIVFSTIIR